MRLIRLLKNELAGEIDDWLEAGLVTSNQAELLRDRYGITSDSGTSFGYNLLIGLGFLFVGLSVITVLGANWDDLPRSLRLWGLILVTVGTQTVALWRYRQGNSDQAVAICFLGNFLYGASIILIAQIYHLGEHMPDGIFWWAFGCLPFALVFNSRLIVLQSVVLAVIWFLVEVDTGFYPSMFPVFMLALGIVLYRGGGSLFLFLMLAFCFGLWLTYSSAAFWQQSGYLELESEHVVILLSLGALGMGLAGWLQKSRASIHRDYGLLLDTWLLRCLLVVLLVLSFDEPWESLITADWLYVVSMSAISAVLWVTGLLLAARTGRLPLMLTALAFFCLCFATVIVGSSTAHAITLQVFSNLVLIVLGVLLIVLGVRSGVTHYFFLGVFAILVTGFLRYIDLVGEYVGGAILFMVMASVMLGAARYWRLVRRGE